MGRTPPWRANPFMTEPIPCSRIPKWIWAPSGLCRSWAVAPSRATPLFSVRSAEPAISPGMSAAVALMAAFTARRVANSSPALKVGSFSSHPGRPRPVGHASQTALSPFQLSKRAAHCFFFSRPRPLEFR